MVIALSGKCCSGKDYVASILSKHGFEVIDVDKISHRVFKDRESQIINHFGDSILTNGVIDRKKLGKIVFSNKRKKEELEKIIHPGVYDEIFEVLSNHGDYIVNIPLLTSDEFVSKCDLIVWVDSPFVLRLVRALKRDNYSILTVFKRIISQLKLSVKHFNWNVDIYSIRNGFNFKKIEKEVKDLLIKIDRG